MAIVLRSRTERMRTLSAIQTGLGLVALATVLLAAALSYGVARTVTDRWPRITDHMRDVAATGDLTRKLRLSDSRSWHDEDTRLLAATFNTLTDSIARFQREAAQRERLSSLGRMSTIIAHEIRNPLMIIKGALRQLTREGATADDIRERPPTSTARSSGSTASSTKCSTSPGRSASSARRPTSTPSAATRQRRRAPRRRAARSSDRARSDRARARHRRREACEPCSSTC